MGQSLVNIYVHAVFGTKFRQPLIKEEVMDEYHMYMTGIFKGLNCPLLRINSMPDHTHVLFRLSNTKTVSKVMEIAKKDSSKWMKTKGISDFKWQGGYGAFSVSESQIEIVTSYIINQKKHHAKMTYKKEIAQLMKMHGIDTYSDDYFWS